MAIPDNYIDKITKGNDSRMISPAADMVRVNNDNFNGADLDEVLDDVAQAISGKANTADLATVATSGSYNDLSNKPTIPDTSTLATKTELNTKQDVINDLATIRSGAGKGATAIQQADLAAVATSGSYNDLADKPTIPAAYDDTALAARVTVLEGQTHNVTYNQSTTTLTIQ